MVACTIGASAATVVVPKSKKKQKVLVAEIKLLNDLKSAVSNCENISNIAASQTAAGCMQNSSSSSAAALVDQLKQQLQLAIENGNERGVLDVIAHLEKLALNKEVLEVGF
jgi:hypothetical protein